MARDDKTIAREATEPRGSTAQKASRHEAEAEKPKTSSQEKATPRKYFVPSEKIVPDQAVAFPVDM